MLHAQLCELHKSQKLFKRNTIVLSSFQKGSVFVTSQGLYETEMGLSGPSWSVSSFTIGMTAIV